MLLVCKFLGIPLERAGAAPFSVVATGLSLYRSTHVEQIVFFDWDTDFLSY